MLARNSVPLFVSAIAILAACNSDPADPFEASAVDRVDLQIDGPDVIVRSGSYSWIAVTDGSNNRFDFSWQVFWNGVEDVAARTDGDKLTVDVDVNRGQLVIRLHARSGDGVYNAERFATCAGTPLEDRLILECELKD